MLRCNADDDVFQVDRALLAQYQVARYHFGGSGAVPDHRSDRRKALGLQTRQYGAGMKLNAVRPDRNRPEEASRSLDRRGAAARGGKTFGHASLSTTPIYLHGDEVKSATQMRAAFTERGLKSLEINRLQRL